MGLTLGASAGGFALPDSLRRANVGILVTSPGGPLVRRLVRYLALIVLLVAPAAAFADLNIPLQCRIKNRPPGRCGWCALETCARHQRVKALFGITDEHDSRCDPENQEAVLVQKHLAYRIQPRGNCDTAILSQAIREGRGVV